MKDSILYRRFAIVAVFIAVVGILMANLIQETRPHQRAYLPDTVHYTNCSGDQLCASPVMFVASIS